MREATARRRVETFRRHHGDPHLHLACHAAVPLALSPDLAYRLWANFQRDTSGVVLGVPWVAVADLLLSSLCDEVGDELYEMDVAVRSMLLERLATDTRFGPDRLRRVAAFLDDYVEQQLSSGDIDTRDFAEAQHWAALAYTAPSAAASELAHAFAAVPLADKPEVVRIASVVEALATPLESFPTLLTYAQAAQSLARGRDHPAVRGLQSLAGPENRVEVVGVSVPVPSQLLGGPGESPPAHKGSWAALNDPSLSDPRDPKTLLIIDMLSESIYRTDETIALLEAAGLKPGLYPHGTAKQMWTAAIPDAAREGKLPVLIDRIVDEHPPFGRELERRLQSLPPPPSPPGDLDGLSEEQIGLLRRTITTLGDLMDTSAELERIIRLPEDFANTSARLQRSLNQAKNQFLVLERDVSVTTWPHKDWAIAFTAARAQAQLDVRAVEERLYRATASRDFVASDRDLQFRQSVVKLQRLLEELQRLLEEQYPSIFMRPEVAVLAVGPDDHLDEFSWEASLNRARSALERRDPEATSALLQAFADALRMAELCHDELVRRGPMPLPQDTFEDWNKFLMTLYNDAWKLYPHYSYLVKSYQEDLQMTFETVRDAARAALLELQDMNAAKPSLRAREAVVVKLSKLVIALDAAKAVLGHS
jgi:hypothetical protein